MKDAILKLVSLFTQRQRREGAMLVLLMVGGMVMETLGIGMVIPAMMLLTQQDLGARFPQLYAWLNLGAYGRDQVVIVGMLLLAAVFTAKCAYVAFVTSRQFRFVFRVQAHVSRELFISYLHKPWTFHLQRNSAELVRNVIVATNELTMTGLLAVLLLVTEGLVVLGISLLLLWIEPLGALCSAAFLASFGYLFNRATRRAVRRAGEERQQHEEQRIRWLQQALGGAKELKLLAREEGVIAQYTPPNEASARIGQYSATLQALPKLWLELLAVLGLVVLVVTLVLQGKPVEGLVPTLGMFAAAAFRLIPSLNRILGSVQYLRMSIPVIDMLHSELHAPVEHPAPAGATTPLREGLRVQGLAVRYEDAAQPAISGVDFSIERGTTVGFIGGSGSGKSTLIDAMLGLLPAEKGRILADGADIHGDLRGWQSRIGYVPQAMFLTDDSIRRNIAFGLPDEMIDEAAVARALSAAQLDEFIRGLPEGLETPVGERGVRLSGGQRQRIAIARALYHNPEVLVLDEATSALDAETEDGVMQAINALHGSKTILIVTHRASTLAYCDRVVRVEDGVAREVPAA
jgi:ABC-type multidrug transport system fused ATPase/permease subunit